MSVKVEVKDVGWVEFFKTIQEIKDKRIKVGVLSNDAHDAEGGITLAELAAVHEFGTEDGHVPARGFMRSTFDQNREQYVQYGEKLIDAVLAGKMKTDKALSILGQKIASDMRDMIRTSIPPPNAPSTIAMKGSSVTLIDTGRMINAVTYAIVEGDEEED